VIGTTGSGATPPSLDAEQPRSRKRLSRPNGVAANKGTASHAQRAALATALMKADALPDDLLCEAVNAARHEVGLPQ